MPTGTLTKKIHSHESRSVRIAARAERLQRRRSRRPHPMRRVRCCARAPRGTSVVRIESAAGVMVAAPSPWSARATISDVSLQASPQSSEPTEKMTIPP